MSQADVARALDAHPSAVHYWCRGAKPRDPAMLVRIQRWSRGDVNADAPAQVAAESPDTEKAAVG